MPGARRPVSDELDLVPDRDLAALDDVREHAALAFELGAQARAQLIHPLARVADHRDLEQRATDAHALPHRPLVDIGALHGDVLADRAGRDVESIEVLLRREQDLAARRVRMGAALEPVRLDRDHALAGLRAAAPTLGRDEETGHSCHAPSVSIESGVVIWLLVLLGIVLLLVVLGVLFYNNLVRLRNRVDNSWAQIEVQLKRRWDLIPNLIETVKGYAAHERETFEAVTAARTRAQQAQTPAETAQAEGILGQALGRLFAVAEAYPELQADENFRQLQTELAETENRIATSRQVYNDTVLTYNNAIQTFPGAVLAGPLGFTGREFFDVEDEAQREPPRVDFAR
jgi:LemA protein